MQTGNRAYIVVLGSLMSGLGKGIVSSSIAKILQAKGLSVIPIKFDGYLNVDCGTMNPYRHGEVFVLDDGTECDMDFGTYERFLNIDIGGDSSITGGKIFKTIIEKERRGEFLGRDVQIVPHLTDEIKGWVRKVGDKRNADVVIIEVGGTVGDLENAYFIEAMRQLKNEEKVFFVQLTFVPKMETTGEQKTKPTQHANRLLLSLGIKPDLVICRETEPLGKEVKEKISLFCGVPLEAVIDDPDLKTIYELPDLFEKANVGEVITKALDLKTKKHDLENWSKLVGRITKPSKKVKIAITGKYTALRDAYVSIHEALRHAGAHLDCEVEVKWVETTHVEDGKITPAAALKDIDALITPGGFGARGTEGKIQCIQYARENKIPYLGLCLGMQLMVVEWARNVANLKDANSTEFNKDSPYPVIDVLPEQKRIVDKGATMRLGAWSVKVLKGTAAYDIYKKELISERHRHRYEVNPDYVQKLKESGLIISGVTEKGDITEICEWPGQFGIATQAHPEFKSRLEAPAPLFLELVKRALENQKK